MSFNGFVQFEKNLRKMMDSPAFKESDPVKQLKLGGLLLRSRYGVPLIGSVKPLPDPPSK